MLRWEEVPTPTPGPGEVLVEANGMVGKIILDPTLLGVMGHSPSLIRRG